MLSHRVLANKRDPLSPQCVRRVAGLDLTSTRSRFVWAEKRLGTEKHQMRLGRSSV